MVLYGFHGCFEEPAASFQIHSGFPTKILYLFNILKHGIIIKFLISFLINFEVANHLQKLVRIY